MRSPFRRRRFERDMSEEMRFHLEMESRELAAAGLSDAEAKRRALVAFGGVDRFKEQSRAEYPGSLLHDLWRDAQFATRWLSSAPAFTAAAVLTLGIGVGASAAILGTANHILLEPLPYAESERLVTLRETDRSEPGATFDASIANFLQLQARSRSFASLGIAEPSGYDLVDRGSTQSISAHRVTEGFMSALGAKPAAGRAFTAADFRPGAPPVVILSDDVWRRRFGAQPGIVGTTIRLDDFNATVIGILPRGLPFPEARDLWVPRVARAGDASDNGRYMVAVGRLRDGVTPERAQAEASAIAATLARETPRTNHTVSLSLIAIDDFIFGPVRTAILVLSGAVALLLLIACANIANLLLARGLQRRRELAVRVALGANARRLLRQLLTESLILAMLGGALGVVFAWLGVRAIRAFAPAGLPRVETLQVDATLVAIAFLITLATGALVGVVPALRFSRVSGVFGALRGGSWTIGGELRTVRLRRLLVSFEIAFAIILLVAAGLLGRSFLQLTATELGFTPESRVEWQTFLWDRNQTAEQRIERVRALERQIATANGITAVAAGSALPFHPHRIAQTREVHVPGRAPTITAPRAVLNVITPAYFDVMEIRVLRGRPFTEHDAGTGRRVAILNQVAASDLFAGTDPIGRLIEITDDGQPVSLEVVGVVANVRVTGLDQDAEPEIYIPHAQDGFGSMTFVASTRGSPAARLSDGAAAIWRADPGQSIYHSATMESLVAATLAERRFHLVLIAVFSLIGLLVSTIGVYGLLNFMVRARSREIGLRMALGAGRSTVLSMVLREATAMTLPGVAIGLAGAFMLTRVMRGMLYDVAPADAVTFLGISVTVLLAAHVAAFLPAWRAATVEPMTVLRAD